MHSRIRNSRIRKAAAIAGPVVLIMTMATTGAFANHGLASLPGSQFEIDNDANLKLDDGAGFTDWATLAHTGANAPEIRATDKVNGTGDDSYAGGVKEDTSCPSATTDSIPPNKSDLLSFHVYKEAGTATHPGFMNLAWSRVSEPEGTTLMDFEFNASKTKCANGPNIVRTTGDLLIEYAIDQGGARADITARRWTGTAWGPVIDLDANSTTCPKADGTPGPCAVGTINDSPIPAAESDGLIPSGEKEPFTFGEAQIDLRFIFQPNKCAALGSAMLKSRSSDSFTSQLKDFVAPVGIDIANCGRVVIRKQTIPEEDPNTTNFGFTKTFNTDPTTTNSFTLQDDGVKDYGKTVLFGANYVVDEAVIPANWALQSIDCNVAANPSSGVTPVVDVAAGTVTFNIDSDSDVLDCTYTNELQLGALRILKNSTKGGAVSQPGAVFSYGSASVTDNGTGDEDPEVGEVCVSGLPLGDYSVTETSPPPGYADAPGDPQTVTVVTGTNCTNNQPSGAAVATFTNAPLADIQVRFRDGGSGETLLTGTGITCDAGVTEDTTDTANWDDTSTYAGIPISPSPKTITCTIVIDP